MNSTLTNPLQIGSGLWNRLFAAFSSDPAKFEPGESLHYTCAAHLPLLRAAAKLATPPPAVTLTGPPSVAAIASLAQSTDPAVRRIESEFAALETEQERDNYVLTMARGIVHPMATTKPAAVPVKPTAPALSLDAQYAALTTQTDKAAFLKEHAATALKR